MPNRHYTLREDFNKNRIKFKAQQISSRFSQADQERISGQFVLSVIGLIFLEIIVSYFFSFDQIFPILTTMILVFIGYRIMNKYLQTYDDVGTIYFSDHQIEFSNPKFNQRNVIDYSEINLIRGFPGIPHQVFRGRNPQEEFLSLKIRFLLNNDVNVECEICTKVSIIKLEQNTIVNRTVNIEAILKEIGKGYLIIDTFSFKYAPNWGME